MSRITNSYWPGFRRTEFWTVVPTSPLQAWMTLVVPSGIPTLSDVGLSSANWAIAGVLRRSTMRASDVTCSPWALTTRGVGNF